MKYNPSKHLETINGRKVVLRALVGSRIYNLEEENSDYDYKIFVLPTIDDLLNNKMVSHSYKDENGNDVDLKDIRLLSQMLEKCNPAYIQIPYSNQFDGDERLIKLLTKNRFNFILNNPSGFVKSTIGICLEKLKAIEKDLPKEITNEGFERRIKFGFDTKQLLHIVRLTNVVFDLNPDKNIFWEETIKDLLLNLKNKAIHNDYILDKNNALMLGKQFIDEIRNSEIAIVKDLKKIKLEHNPIKSVDELIKQLLIEQFKSE